MCFSRDTPAILLPKMATKRLEARAKLKETESKIESTVYQRGIKLPVEFATFKNMHIEALYGGVTASQLEKVRNIPILKAKKP